MCLVVLGNVNCCTKSNRVKMNKIGLSLCCQNDGNEHFILCAFDILTDLWAVEHLPIPLRLRQNQHPSGVLVRLGPFRYLVTLQLSKPFVCLDSQFVQIIKNL